MRLNFTEQVQEFDHKWGSQISEYYLSHIFPVIFTCFFKTSQNNFIWGNCSTASSATWGITRWSNRYNTANPWQWKLKYGRKNLHKFVLKYRSISWWIQAISNKSEPLSSRNCTVRTKLPTFDKLIKYNQPHSINHWSFIKCFSTSSSRRQFKF